MFRDRFWLSLALSVPVLLCSEMIQDWLGFSLPTFPGDDLVAPILGSAVFLYGGQPFLTGGLEEARARRPGMMLLIALALIVAFGASVASAVGWLDLEFWWELALLVDVMLLGHWLEMRALGQATSALEALATLLPDMAERVTESGTEEVTLDALRPGDVLLVRSGARVPADGTIVEGEAAFDESMITGESRPVMRGPGDRIVGGTIATDSSVRVRVTAVGEETTLAGIRRLVAEAQASRSRAQALADRAAALLFYVALASGTITLIAWLAAGEPDQALERTVTVLVIACPHALGLAIPLVVAISTAMSARERDPREGPPRPRADAHGRHRAPRQDGNADHRNARRPRGRRIRRRRRHEALARGGRRGRQRAPARARDRGGGAPSRARRSWPRRASGRSPAVGSARTCRGPRSRWEALRCCGSWRW